MASEPMTLAQCQEAIRQHGITAGHMQKAAGARGAFELAGRCEAISAAAAKGVLLMPMPSEPSIPDLVAAATQYGLVQAPDTLPPVPE
jgi:hypothetical protein